MTEYSKKEEYMASQVSIMDYLQSRGYTCKHVGSRQEYKFKDIGNSFYVNPQKNCFNWYSHSVGGGPIQCLQEVFGLDKNSAIRELIGEPSQDRYIPKYKTAEKISEPDEKREFIIPEKSESCNRVYGYLTKQRRLDAEIINDFVNQGILYQGYAKFGANNDSKKYENAIFLHINENGVPCGADVQGLCSSTRFKGIVPPDETDKGFVYIKGEQEKVDTVYLFEAPIDLMSFVELHPEIENAKFVSMGGVKPTIADHYINSNMTVISCVDNDLAGQEFNNRILKGKMQDSLSTAGGTNLYSKKYPDREPPIEYIIANLNGKQCSFFLSGEDFRDARDSKIEIAQSSFIWANRSNFQINKECAEAGVKDFNELLKLKKDSDFSKEVSRAAEWAEKAQAKAQERLNYRTVEISK